MTEQMIQNTGAGKKRLAARIGIGAAILFACNALFFLFMVFAFSAAPQERVRAHVEESLGTIRNDLNASPLIDETKAFMPDWRYDMIWIDIAANEPESALRSAMTLPYLQSDGDWEGENANEESFYVLLVPLLYYPDAEDVEEHTYARYWMVLTGILRLLFVFLELKEIRMLLWCAALFLFVYVAGRMAQKLGMKYAMALAIAFFSRNLLLHVFSLTTAIDVLVTLCGLAVLLTWYEKPAFCENRLYYYLILGILCFSVGSIIAPLLTLGLPLITELALAGHGMAKEQQPMRRFAEIFLASVSWLIGFAGSMVIKTVLATAIAGDGGDTSGRFLEYLQPGTSLRDRFYIIGYCLEGVFAPNGIKRLILIAAAAGFVLLIALRGYRKINAAPWILIVGLYPIVWSIILVGHSSHFFVANIYAVVVYAFFMILAELSGKNCL